MMQVCQILSKRSKILIFFATSIYAHTLHAPLRRSRSCTARQQANSGSGSKGHHLTLHSMGTALAEFGKIQRTKST